MWVFWREKNEYTVYFEKVKKWNSLDFILSWIFKIHDDLPNSPNMLIKSFLHKLIEISRVNSHGNAIEKLKNEK